MTSRALYCEASSVSNTIKLVKSVRFSKIITKINKQYKIYFFLFCLLREREKESSKQTTITIALMIICCGFQKRKIHEK